MPDINLISFFDKICDFLNKGNTVDFGVSQALHAVPHVKLLLVRKMGLAEDC